MSEPKPSPSQSYLQEAFDYSPETGEFRWRVRPEFHFNTKSGWKRFNNLFAGKLAGSPVRSNGVEGQNGYLIVTLTVDGEKKVYRAHRLIWVYMYGDDPGDALDHKTGAGDPNDVMSCHFSNRISNLRKAVNNSRNHGGHSANTTGIPGVSKTDTGKYAAQSTFNGEWWGGPPRPTPEQAARDYLEEVERRGLGEWLPRSFDWNSVRHVEREDPQHYGTNTFKGVIYHKRDDAWQVQLYPGGKQQHIGYRKTEEQALKLRDQWLTERGINIPDGPRASVTSSTSRQCANDNQYTIRPVGATSSEAAIAA